MVLAACSYEPDPADGESAAAPAATPGEEAWDAPPPTAAPTTGADILALEGLDDLRIGAALPAGSSWAERGAQTSDSCRIVTSRDYPGAYAIVERGKIRRITVGDRSAVKLAEGIGVGASEAEVREWFPFPATPHEYQEAPAKYLTAPNAANGDSALRFEIDAEGKVSAIHVGTMPVLGYTEGCA